MANSMVEATPISVSEVENRLSERLVTAAIMLGEAATLPAYDSEMMPIQKNNAAFNNRFLEAVFLGDAKAQASVRDRKHTPELWLPEVCKAIRHAAKIAPTLRGMEKMRLYTNPKIYEGAYEDMMQRVLHADGTPFRTGDTLGRDYAAKVALNEIIFSSRALS